MRQDCLGTILVQKYVGLLLTSKRKVRESESIDQLRKKCLTPSTDGKENKIHGTPVPIEKFRVKGIIIIVICESIT